ncbi:uncharacterized protein [Diabrotica undecimpunctata]|uniref:uncharacterized protein n=1 Tax=Diabrotica undecimpunctata TaxID=50387 RepID=UPI003B631AD6
MRWIFLVAIFLTIHSAFSEEDEEYNDVSPPIPKINLDSNLRRALLKALTELENEEKEKAQYSVVSNSEEKIVEKASAASVSIYANADSVTASPTPPSTTINTDQTTSETYNVILQKSEAIQQKPITNFEKGEEAESILTSASNNFADQSFGKDAQSEKSEANSQNSIFNSEKTTTKLSKPQTTTIPPKVSTEESEAKAEDVQFFSAPLVAAFTVHQDELGLPKRVEPIFRLAKTAEEIRIENEQIKLVKKFQEEKIANEQIRLEELRKTRDKLQIQQKQKALEEEIVRLNLNLKQQQDFLLRQQEDFRLRSNAQSFGPINNPQFSTPSPVLNLVQQPPSSVSQVFKPNLNLVQQLPVVSNVQQFKAQAVTIQPSLSFNSLPDGGKLPHNAQFLPVKGPVDFRTPFTANNINQPHFPQSNNFNQQTSNTLNQQNQNSNRFFRQNNGFGNFGTNDFSTNTNSFSIQPAIQQNFNNGQSNRFFRSNTESTLTAPQFLQPPHLPTHQQSNRFFRSNLENPFNSNQANNNYQLSNLLYTSGAFRGKSPEDLSLISKVLSLNHVGGRNPGISLRPELQGSFGRNF